MTASRAKQFFRFFKRIFLRRANSNSNGAGGGGALNKWDNTAHTRVATGGGSVSGGFGAGPLESSPQATVAATASTTRSSGAKAADHQNGPKAVVLFSGQKVVSYPKALKRRIGSNSIVEWNQEIRIPFKVRVNICTRTVHQIFICRQFQVQYSYSRSPKYSTDLTDYTCTTLYGASNR